MVKQNSLFEMRENSTYHSKPVSEFLLLQPSMNPFLPPLDLVGDVVSDLDERGIGHLSWSGEIYHNLLLDLGRLVGQNQDTLSQIYSFLDVMRNENDCRASFFPKTYDLILQVEAKLDVHLPVGFIHQKQVGLQGEGTTDDDTLGSGNG